jgi:Flp pilus assembly CpaE family ATPase
MIVTTINIRLSLVERRLVATAQITNARLITGTEKMINIIPIFEVAIDTCSRRDAANRAAIISRMAPQRSALGALLKNAHHIAIASPPSKPANTPINKGWSPGMTDGRPNLISH